MKKHILLEKAFIYNEPLEKNLSPQDCTYNELKGYWVTNENSEVMMLSENAKIPQTKKEDVETGEDQKGE